MLVFLFSGISSANEENGFHYTEFSKIPILHEGRVKPLDSFARIYLQIFNGKQQINEMDAVAWLAEVLFDREKSYKRPIFNIANPQLAKFLKLQEREGRRYSFLEISDSFSNQEEALLSIFKIVPQNRSLEQNQIVDLYLKLKMFSEISSSLSLLLPEFKISSKNLADQLDMDNDNLYNYFYMIKKQDVVRNILSKTLSNSGGDISKLSADEQEIIYISYKLESTKSDSYSKLFRIIPPQWNDKSGEWFSPWSLLQEGHGSTNSSKYLKLWADLAISYKEKDYDRWREISSEIKNQSYLMAENYADEKIVSLEASYNKWDLFYKSLISYILAFLGILASSILYKKYLIKASTIFLILGAGAHLLGMVIRMIIMSRPPVTTLYESIIFVGLIGVIFSLILEYRYKNGIGVIIGSAMGAILHFIGMKYAADGDTMGVLIAVLDTNFWLATHVVTITIGYGCCFVAGIIAHIYLISSVRASANKKSLKNLYKNMFGVSLVALFFSVLGTILGGIWADQSWGRFWGWDPKENGAMLICLWLIWMIHGKIAGIFKEYSFAIGMVITNIIVALAWFGVNLLNVGLHSYGFTEGIAFNLAIFCAIELLFILIVHFLRTGKKSVIK
ncbi:cytochrome c biogenesis protein CcsA [Rickettsiales bacterium]|nr:cytochrome c biogenesis protein CcsA [Rickettsiales bacterium]